MTNIEIIDVLYVLLRWRVNQQPDYVLSVSSVGVTVAAAPCACASIAVDCDFPPDADFLPTLEARLDREWRAAVANCICGHGPYTVDVAGMGRDMPVAMNLECNCCDSRGPSDPSEAKREGWVNVGPVGREERGHEWYNFLGWCPLCTAFLAGQDRADLGDDAA